MTAPRPPRRVGLIGLGAIGMPVAQALTNGEIEGFTLSAVLARSSNRARPIPVLHDADRFFTQPFDLIIEAAGPTAFALHAERALACADVWTVSAAALADAPLLDRLRAVALNHQHRLRVLHGAIAALDGVSAASVDPQAQLHLTIELPPNGDAPSLLFSGSVRDASLRYANSVNVAAAAALAGPGLDAARIDVRRAPPGVMQTLSLAVDSRYGTHAASSQPRVAPGVHPVAACIVAALRRESAWLWAG